MSESSSPPKESPVVEVCLQPSAHLGFIHSDKSDSEKTEKDLLPRDDLNMTRPESPFVLPMHSFSTPTKHLSTLPEGIKEEPILDSTASISDSGSRYSNGHEPALNTAKGRGSSPSHLDSFNQFTTSSHVEDLLKTGNPALMADFIKHQSSIISALEKKLQALEEKQPAKKSHDRHALVSTSEESSESVKDVQSKNVVIFSTKYSQDSHEIMSLSIEQIESSKFFWPMRTASLSPGRLADVSSESSGSFEGRVLKPPLPTTAWSKMRQCGRHSTKLAALKSFPFTITKPSTCVCSCYCSLYFDNITPTNSSPSTEVSSSSIESVPGKGNKTTKGRQTSKMNKSLDVSMGKKLAGVLNKSSDASAALPTVTSSDSCPEKRPWGRKKKIKPEPTGSLEDYMEDWVCPDECMFRQHFYVFAKWPADKKYYAGMIENSGLNDWHNNLESNVKFFDGAVQKINTCASFPAFLMRPGAEVMYADETGSYTTAHIIAVKRKHLCEPVRKLKSCVYYCVQLENDVQEIEVPFDKVGVSVSFYKKVLKKQIGASLLTPMKFHSAKKCDAISTVNLTEGKRSRTPMDRNLSDSRTDLSESRRKRGSKTFVPERRGLKRKLDVIPDENHTSSAEAGEVRVEQTVTQSNVRRQSAGSSLGSTSKVGKSKSAMKKKRKNPDDDSDTEYNYGKKLIRAKSVSESVKKSSTKRLKTVEKSTRTCLIGSARSSSTKSDCKGESSSVKKGKVTGGVAGPPRECLPSTSRAKRAPRRLLPQFRDKVFTPCSDSDSDSECRDLRGIGGGMLDDECTPTVCTNIKYSGQRPRKSSTKSQLVVEEDADLVQVQGPIPSEPLFEGYCFVFTHAGPFSLYHKESQLPKTDCSELSSDYEEQFIVNVPFDLVRLRKQILAGKGEVYLHMSSVPQDRLKKTLLITDRPSLTPNYLLALALNIPIYQHILVVNCCKENKPLSGQLKLAQLLPAGKTKGGEWLELSSKRKKEILKDYLVILSTTKSNCRLKFWNMLIKLGAGKVVCSTPEKLGLGCVSSASVVLVDDFTPKPLLRVAEEQEVPTVTTRWLVDSFIQGHLLPVTEYKPAETPSSSHHLSTSSS